MTRLTKEQKELKQRLIATHGKLAAFSHIPTNWDKKLWNKSTQAIYEYIKERMETTEDEVEYYTCLVYLRKRVPDAELLVEWKDSKNRARMAASYSKDVPATDQMSNHKHNVSKTNKKQTKRTKKDVCATEPIEIMECIEVIGVSK